jgi:hypothetical protein
VNIRSDYIPGSSITNLEGVGRKELCVTRNEWEEGSWPLENECAWMSGGELLKVELKSLFLFFRGTNREEDVRRKEWGVKHGEWRFIRTCDVEY